MINWMHKIATLILRKLQAMMGLATIGPRAIVLNEENQVLLVKHTYVSDWHLPGGGLKSGESTKKELKRELMEEVGLQIEEEPQLFGIYYHTFMGVNDYPVIYIVRKFKRVHANSPEIKESRWFSFENLPDTISTGTHRRLNEYFKQLPPSERW